MAGADNHDANPNNIIFTIKDTNLYRIIKYIKITKLFVIESLHQVCTNCKTSILYCKGNLIKPINNILKTRKNL